MNRLEVLLRNPCVATDDLLMFGHKCGFTIYQYKYKYISIYIYIYMLYTHMCVGSLCMCMHAHYVHVHTFVPGLSNSDSSPADQDDHDHRCRRPLTQTAGNHREPGDDRLAGFRSNVLRRSSRCVPRNTFYPLAQSPILFYIRYCILGLGSGTT